MSAIAGITIVLVSIPVIVVIGWGLDLILSKYRKK